MYRVRTNISGGITGPGLSTFYFNDTSPATAQHAADAVHTFWDSIKNRVVNTVTFQVDPTVYTIDVTTGHPTLVTPVTAAPVVGQSTADPLPYSLQGLIEMHTGFFPGGREVRGRLFIPGADESLSTLGVPIAAYISSLQTAANALIADPNADWVVWSRKNHTVQPVTSAGVWNQWAVLRSRRD